MACGDNAGLIPDVNEPGLAEEQELIPISFNLGFSLEVTPLRASASAFNLKYLDYLVFTAYDEDDIHGTAGPGMLYKKRSFINSDGHIQDSLPSGYYHVVFVANNESPFLFTGENALEGVSMTTSLSAVPEVFYSSGFIHIENKEELREDYAYLYRNVGKVEIVVEDIIPADVETIEITVQPMAHTYIIQCGSSGDSIATMFDHVQMSGSLSQLGSITENDEGNRTMLPFSFLSYENIEAWRIEKEERPDGPGFLIEAVPVRTPVTITMQVYGGGNLLAEKQITNVDILRNKTVRYTGHLFENTAFSLLVDDNWTGTEEITF
ncbi:MAG: FimB/Mfa2 family fimbrial subunit [Dysgonamonadaceae bacterium]|nr:FimB/Mfa2 family fimbrial subunit [Dysgonamonadaceae bacterium]